MAKKTKKTDTMRSLESDLIRAISGGTEQQVAETIQRVQEADVERPTTQSLQQRVESQAAQIQSEIETLQADQAAGQQEVADINADIAFQESVRASIPELAAGRADVITATGPQVMDPYEKFMAAQAATQKRDAFQSIVNAFTTYGIEGIADTVFALMADPTIGEEQAVYKLKFDTSLNPTTGRPWNEAYSKRFAANFERIKAGKPALSEGEYLTAERSYARALQGLGVSRLATRDNFNKFIAGDVSTDEVVDRVNIAVTRIEGAPKETRDALAQFYPNLSVLDIAEAVLDPEITLPALRRKIQAAEIGGGALRAGLGVTRGRAEELGQLGITEEQARAGFQQIAGGLPRGGQLAAIYQQGPYGQETAEAEVFGTAGAVQARRQRQKIIRSEEAAFGGQTGLTGGALSRERAGQI